MNNQELQAWASDPSRAGTLPYAVFEPRYPHDGVGSALVVRGVLYFKGGYSRDVRRALATCFDQYSAVAADALRWFCQDGKRPIKMAKAPAVASLANSVSEDESFTFVYSSADAIREAALYEFTVFCLEKWQAAMGTRGLDVLVFSLPVPAVKADPDLMPRLFGTFANLLSAVHGHAGYAVTLPPTGRDENESSEYYMSQQLGPGIDVGDPLATKVRDLVDRIKTVDWLTLIDDGMLKRAGELSALQSELPKHWFSLTPCAQGLLIRAGVLPQAGTPQGDGEPIAPPPAYVVLNAALRDIQADTVSILQRGTANGDAPVYNSKPSSDAWLRRFDVSEAGLLEAKAAVLDTPKVNPD